MSDSSTPSTEPAVEMVRLYNKGLTRSYIHDPYRLNPVSFATVPADIAKKWTDLSFGEVVTAEQATNEVGGATTRANIAEAALADANKKIAALEAAVNKSDPKKVAADLKAATAALADLQAKHDVLESQLEAATAPAAPDAKSAV